MVMLQFIPVDDPADTADDAGQLYQLDFGAVLVGYVETRSFRLGNLGATAVAYTFSLDAMGMPEDGYELPDAGTIPPGATSDTLTLRITPPADTTDNYAWVMTLTATADNGDSISIPVTMETVFDRIVRRNETAIRSTSQTDVFTSQIDRTSEWMRLWIYDPVAYDPESQSQIYVQPGDRQLEGDASNHRFRSIVDPCERLNPYNAEWGYTCSTYRIRAHWQPEVDSLTTTFAFNNTDMTYESTASIIIPAPYQNQLYRLWALFAPANAADEAQYKRTVFIVRRNSEYWALQDVVLPPLGDRMTYCEGTLIKLHNPAMGSKQFFNPFAMTYSNGSNKPYKAYPCTWTFDDWLDEYGSDEYGSDENGALDDSEGQ
jgi:hypothetical protein